MTTTPCAPLRPFRILRPAAARKPWAVYYQTREARDDAAQRWADTLGAEVSTERWDIDGAHDGLNRGWGCDGVVQPRELVTLSLHIENHYELYGLIVTTPTVTVPAPPVRDASTSEEEHAEELSEWEWEHINAATGAGRTRGDASYFVTVKESSRPDLIPVGQEYEFGV